MKGKEGAEEGKKEVKEGEEWATKRGERDEEGSKGKSGEGAEGTVEGGKIGTVRTNKHVLPTAALSGTQKRDASQKSGHKPLTEAPSISIQPDTRLELTEEMIQGENWEVVTNDTLLAKASSTNLHEMEVRAVPLCPVYWSSNLCILQYVSNLRNIVSLYFIIVSNL